VVITLSRQAESGGEGIAQVAAHRLGLQIADRAILERIAQREGLPAAHLAVFDEAVPGALEAVITEWRTSMSPAVYLRRLVHILITLEREDNVLIVGRGAAFVLTDPGTLHARVVAPMPHRVAAMMQRERISPAEAERALTRSDAGRARFVRRAFDADIEACCHYDLTLNTAELAQEEAAEIIILAAQRKALRRAVLAETSEDSLAQALGFRRRPRFPRVSEVVWRHYRRRA
jgi:hypothetical protein